ncbi:uncharacterized protein PHALS_06365 [Plasmopara halstedii]|uniref:Uncharacterized protein n=1 Tax=Plasmopara halstedii TaxID=4781 RepID=A0A0N7L807_PLAHL|nr:uncharacterized protein PHALS_06365 [Plasmopara halstedii]CEG48547.1 hypothetical protein PHALS_06365 [Plasmopara halstedii]|eukprot:XP_024584916.1 hypothetical protein PHALS_06365 [Plasmopara halstedii]
MLGKRIASEIEACLTEYYRQECLRALYTKKNHLQDCTWINKDMMAKSTRRSRKGVSFALVPEIIGRADPTVDRSPIDVSPVSKLELILLCSERTFPVQA